MWGTQDTCKVIFLPCTLQWYVIVPHCIIIRMKLYISTKVKDARYITCCMPNIISVTPNLEHSSQFDRHLLHVKLSSVHQTTVVVVWMFHPKLLINAPPRTSVSPNRDVVCEFLTGSELVYRCCHWNSWVNLMPLYNVHNLCEWNDLLIKVEK